MIPSMRELERKGLKIKSGRESMYVKKGAREGWSLEAQTG